MKCKMVSADSTWRYLAVEIAVRVLMLVIFFVSEEMTPFQRIIQPEEWWLYKNTFAKHETFNTSNLLAISLLSPIIVIIAVNYFFRRKRHMTSAFLAISLALCLNGNVTNIIKLMVGRPRPDFFFRCFPDGKFPKGQPSPYHLECTGEDYLVTEGRKSFPSGHSSFAFTGLGFSALYLAGQLRCFSPKGRGSSWRLCVALLPLIFAMFIAISRTCDYRHHWQDVVVGSLLGLFITYICYRQHFPQLCHVESDMPYMRTEPGDLVHSRSMDQLQSVFVKRDI